MITPYETHIWIVTIGTLLITTIIMILVSYAIAIINRRRDE